VTRPGSSRRSLSALLFLLVLSLAASLGPELAARWRRARQPEPAVRGARIDMRSIDVNRAGTGLLETLPGIGPALAAEIVRERDRNGRYGSAADLGRVRGIGPALTRKVEPYLIFGP
jgi:competence protein ComEA